MALLCDGVLPAVKFSVVVEAEVAFSVVVAAVAFAFGIISGVMVVSDGVAAGFSTWVLCAEEL